MKERLQTYRFKRDEAVDNSYYADTPRRAQAYRNTALRYAIKIDKLKAKLETT
jgi:hypothetical protein